MNPPIVNAFSPDFVSGLGHIKSVKVVRSVGKPVNRFARANITTPTTDDPKGKFYRLIRTKI